MPRTIKPLKKSVIKPGTKTAVTLKIKKKPETPEIENACTTEIEGAFWMNDIGEFTETEITHGLESEG